MDISLDGSTGGYAGRIEVLEGRSGGRFRSEAERARIAAEWPCRVLMPLRFLIYAA